jgi:glutamate synthase (NADPH/NADH) small chain
LMYRTSSSHQEGGERDFAVMTKRFVAKEGRVVGLVAVRLKFGEPDESGRPTMEEIPDSEFEIPADLVLLAMGFVHPHHDELLIPLGLKLDGRGNIAATTEVEKDGFATSEPGIFAAGDCRRGQSLVVWAIWEGREAARQIDRYLSGTSTLQSRESFV